MRTIGITACLVVGGLALTSAAPSFANDDEGVRATARLVSCTDATQTVARAFLSERESPEGVKEVDVTLFVNNLPQGKHAVHIHEVGACAPTCAAAGSHFDPGPASSNAPVEANHPYHSGDLINVNVNSFGFGIMHHTTSRVTLSPGKLSVFDANGSAIVIHVAEDTYCPTDPSAPGCAGGGRAACGVLQLVTEE